jgi:hypothetical protein
MPSRRACLAILLFWAFAAAGLFQRDILPDMIVGPPPDLRDISRAGVAHPGPTRWTILVVDDRDKTGLNEKAVGQVETETRPQNDGGVIFDSKAWFDANQLFAGGRGLRPGGVTRARGPAPEGDGAPMAEAAGERIEVYGSCWIDSSSNLESFRFAIREGRTASTDLMALEGHLRRDAIEITASGLIPYFGPRSIPYRPHSLVQSPMGPLEWMPNLHVGQRWEAEIVSPLTGQAQKCYSDVKRIAIITWDNNPVSTYELVTRTDDLSARTWVRLDGLVLRQEVPFPLARLVLERVPQDSDRGGR